LTTKIGGSVRIITTQKIIKKEIGKMAIKKTIQRNANNILLTDAFEEYISEKEALGVAAPTIKNYR